MDALQNPIVLDQNTLEGVVRDLRFIPVDNTCPKLLTHADINLFNTHGHAGPFRILDEEEVGDLRHFFDRILADTIAAGGNSYSIATAHRRFGRIWDLMHHPAIVERVADIVGEDVIAWGAHFFCKMPNDGKIVDWHQDAVYWPLTPSKTVTVWLAIDDADIENACMRFISGSHVHGPLTHLPSAASEDNILNLKITDPLRYGTAPFDDVLRAGEASFHTDLLLHGSKANMSTRRRCGITLRYCAADVRASLGWNDKGICVKGTDASHHWGNPSRPQDESVSG